VLNKGGKMVHILSKSCELSDILKASNDNYPEEIANYISVWRGVIVQHISDAVNSSEFKRKKKLKQEAIDWFFQEDSNFAEICELASCEPEIIRNIVRELINGTSRFK
jgi:hypothetical protein